MICICWKHLTTRGACISDDGLFRYHLWRVWEFEKPRLGVVMLNPSTADARDDDPTIRRVMAFAKRDGFGGVSVCNAFAYRATDPTALAERLSLTPADLVVGPENDAHLGYLVASHSAVVVAWGSHLEGRLLRFRRKALASVLHTATCWGTTKAGSPRHPLYLSAATERERYAW